VNEFPAASTAIAVNVFVPSVEVVSETVLDTVCRFPVKVWGALCDPHLAIPEYKPGTVVLEGSVQVTVAVGAVEEFRAYTPETGFNVIVRVGFVVSTLKGAVLNVATLFGLAVVTLAGNSNSW
jgi:hypothetical protein